MNWLILAVMLNGKTKDVDHLKFNSYNDCTSAVQAIQAKEVVVDLFNRTNNTYRDGIQKYYFDEMQNIDLNNYTYPKKLVDLVKNKFPYLIK